MRTVAFPFTFLTFRTWMDSEFRVSFDEFPTGVQSPLRG